MDHTIAAIATAPGEGGIGIIRISGRDSLEILKTVSPLVMALNEENEIVPEIEEILKEENDIIISKNATIEAVSEKNIEENFNVTTGTTKIRNQSNYELTEDILVSALHLVKSTSEDTTYVKYVSKENITEADYLENVAYVGTLSSGKNVIIILPNALCTEAFELERQA